MKKLILLIVCMLPFVMHGQTPDERGFIVKVGDNCPDFSTSLSDGTPVSLNSLKGKPFMLQFTASWCGVCRKEMPHIEEEIWKVYKDKGFSVIGVDRGEALEKVAEFKKTMKISYPLALDEDEAIFRKFADAKAGVTRNVLVNKDGKIVFLTRLYDVEEFEVLKEEIASLMK